MSAKEPLRLGTVLISQDRFVELLGFPLGTIVWNVASFHGSPTFSICVQHSDLPVSFPHDVPVIVEPSGNWADGDFSWNVDRDMVVPSSEKPLHIVLMESRKQSG